MSQILFNNNGTGEVMVKSLFPNQYKHDHSRMNGDTRYINLGFINDQTDKTGWIAIRLAEGNTLFSFSDNEPPMKTEHLGEMIDNHYYHHWHEVQIKNGLIYVINQ